MIKLNLIPYKEKKELGLDKVFVAILVYGTMTIVVVLFFSFLMYTMGQYLESRVDSLSRIIAVDEGSAVSKAIKDLEKNITFSNKTLDKIDGLLKKRIVYSDILDSLSKNKTQSARFSEINLSADQKEGSIIGYVKTRDEALQMKNNLEKNPYIIKVESPLSNLVKPQDITFQFSFKIK